MKHSNMYNTSIFQTVLFEPKETVLWRHHSAPSWQLCWLDTYDKYNMYQYIYVYNYIYIAIALYWYLDIHIFPHINSSPAERCLFFTIIWKRFLVFFWIYARVGFFRAKKAYVFHLWGMPSVAFELDCPLVSHCLPTNCAMSLVVLRATVAT